MDHANDLELLRLISSRLERIPIDSHLAHRASGIRGSLLSILENTDKSQIVSQSEIENLINLGFDILERAAAERVRGVPVRDH